MAVDSTAEPPQEERSVCSPSAPKPAVRPEDEIRAVASKFSDQPLQNPDPGVWAVLTAISKNARQRPQGMNVLLSADEHCLGRCVEDTRFQIAAIAVSASHCRIFREREAAAETELEHNTSVPVFLKDTSTNGTYLNWDRLRKRSPKARLNHGDIISFVAPPHEDNSYAFVYREVCKSSFLANGSVLKRKSEDFLVESKRLKGIGIGAPEGPISLDDVRSLQRSNTELRQQLESHVLTIETLRGENRAIIARHENELKELKDAVSNSYLDQIKELKHELGANKKELDDLNALSAELRHSVKDLNERLCASMQSRSDADEVINSQKASISELEEQLDEERNQRRREREKAAADLKSALHKAQSEAQEEIKRQADVYLRQHGEQQEVISKLQESEKESRLLVETLRSKLEDARESLVISEKKVRQLEVHVQEEQLASANCRKKSEMLEAEIKRLRKDLESEKVAREEAWAKVSALELEISAAIRDLSIEKQRFQGARERIILRETQLRAFYSTTEEITALFAKQQEQLKAMQKTLEDEENYDTASIGIDLNGPATKNVHVTYISGREAHRTNTTKETCSGSTPNNVEATNSGSCDDESATEKHDCDVKSQDGNTQDLECTSADRSVRGFGSDIEGVCAVVVPGGDLNDTERVLGTESPAGDTGADGRNTPVHRCSNLAGDTMQLDDEAQVQEHMEEPIGKLNDREDGLQSKMEEDTDPNTIRTADLLASEAVGSWAVSTAPSVHGENESPGSMGDNAGGEDADATPLVRCSGGQASGSQTKLVYGVTKLTEEHRALNAMIEIVAPDFRQQFQVGDNRVGEERNESMSDAETEDGSNHTDSSDSDEGECGDDADEDGNEVVIEDSVG